jgi:hypothetical protein
MKIDAETIYNAINESSEEVNKEKPNYPHMPNSPTFKELNEAYQEVYKKVAKKLNDHLIYGAKND